MQQTLSKILIASAIAAPFMLHGATIGYWRFETDAFTDSSGNGYDFENTGSVSTRVSIPGTGNGSTFPNPVPQTSAANGFMVTKSTSNFLGTAPIDISSATGENAQKTFTFEAFVNRDSQTGNAFLATYWNGNSSQRSWGIQLEGSAVNLLLSESGSAFDVSGLNTGSSGFSLTEDTDYYLGISVDLTSAVQSERTITYYLQDLTNSGALQTNTITGVSIESIYAAPGTGFTLGNTDGGSFENRLAAQYDEVRYSNTALNQSELLISTIPEPSTYALLFGMGALLLLARRQNRR